MEKFSEAEYTEVNVQRGIDTPYKSVATTGGYNYLNYERMDLIHWSDQDGFGITLDGGEREVASVTVYPGFSLNYVLNTLDALRRSVERDLREAGYET